MALISMRQLQTTLQKMITAYRHSIVNNLEQMRAIMEGADETQSPVIVRASAGARKYAGPTFLRHLILAAIEEFLDIPVVMHQDTVLARGASSIQLGFSSVMMDGSLLEDQKTPAEYDYNVDVTRRVVDMAHACGVSVEGELGCLGSLNPAPLVKKTGSGRKRCFIHGADAYGSGASRRFVQKKLEWTLWRLHGTSHGAYKFCRPPTGDILAIEQVKAIHSRLPNTHLVMHGSSSVPQELLAEINQYGGEIPETYGVPVAEIQQGIKHGVRKVNIDTDLLASTAAIRKFLASNKSEFDPRKYLTASTEAMKAVVIDRYKAFGTEGQAQKLKPHSLDAMQDQYSSGALNQADSITTQNQ